MEPSISRALNDKMYDKRKAGALELERSIREVGAANDWERVGKIIDQLCQDFAYAVHQPHARNGGLIGLAAASIALGPEVARYMHQIVPPVLACFSDQDARVRYYACESMYNIAKVAKGEVLPFFNEVFDALCKLAADSELSVKNGAELLDRLVKDIVSESAATYVSINDNPEGLSLDEKESQEDLGQSFPRAFSLKKFIPLLKERIFVINPFTRVFLVAWITLLDSIPDLELVSYLPEFLGGLFNFLSDPNRDVYAQTQHTLERFLTEIKRIAKVQRTVSEREREQAAEKAKQVDSPQQGEPGDEETQTQEGDDDVAVEEFPDYELNGSWIPGQDVRIDYAKILGILVEYLSTSSEREIQLMALHWIEGFFDDSPGEILLFVPKLLSHVLPALSNSVEKVRQEAEQLNNSLMDFVASLPGPKQADGDTASTPEQPAKRSARSAAIADRHNSLGKRTESQTRDGSASRPLSGQSETVQPFQLGIRPSGLVARGSFYDTQLELDYPAAVDALTEQIRSEHETTRASALTWLVMLHQKAPSRLLSLVSNTFPTLLRTLSDPAEIVVTRDLQLLSQISKTSDDQYFHTLMVNLLQLFASDRKLLETRGNLIIRQLCVNLSAERIYRTMAECIDRELEPGSGNTLGLGADPEFASTMVQNLNNNLITAPELANLRRRLRNLPTTSQGGNPASSPSTPSLSSSTSNLPTSNPQQPSSSQLSSAMDQPSTQSLFTTLFRTFSHNPLSVFTLCLLSQSYEAAYSLLTIIGSELETTLPMLIQIDKLVQLLESPVFTYLRLQLLEPERWPYLYKCLYGLLMLLPQSSAFAALKNRLGSVSAIGYLHVPNRPIGSGLGLMPRDSFDQRVPGRLVGRKDGEGGSVGAGGIRWSELFERFRTIQERARRSRGGFSADDELMSSSALGFGVSSSALPGSARLTGPGQQSTGAGTKGTQGSNPQRPGLKKADTGKTDASVATNTTERSHRKSGLAHLRRLAPGRHKTSSSDG